LTEVPSEALAWALALSTPARWAPRPAYETTLARRITRRGILWVGQTCNLRCHFCYFLDRIENERHPEHAFMGLDKARDICRTLVERYGNNSIDIQGGEPTLWPHIGELVSYCASIGLSPTLVTNAQVLSDRDLVRRLKHAGVRDFLVSVQGLGDVYDSIVGRPGASGLQMKALRNLQEEGVPFRFNTVCSKQALPQLADIARLAIATGAEVVNYLGFNPFNDQASGRRSDENVPRYEEAGAALDVALDVLAEAGVEANVRYLPFCAVAPRHRACVYNFSQIPYDLHENDFASWSWTDLPAQRRADAPLSEPQGLGRRLALGPLRAPLRRLATRLPAVGDRLHQLKQALERAWAEREATTDVAELYQRDARVRAREYTGYRHAPACAACDVRAICDGLHGDYADLFGAAAARPVAAGGPVRDPQHFSRHQPKRVHPLDRAWLHGPAG
jgi:sulfatase maturation enzyme AslB (radical SAM superfamily)